MDGVLTDSEPAFHAAVNDILARYREHISLDEYKRFIGMETPKMWSQVIELKHVPAAVDEIIDEYEAPLMERLREPLPPIPGARELLDARKAPSEEVDSSSSSPRSVLMSIPQNLTRKSSGSFRSAR